VDIYIYRISNISENMLKCLGIFLNIMSIYSSGAAIQFLDKDPMRGTI